MLGKILNLKTFECRQFLVRPLGNEEDNDKDNPGDDLWKQTPETNPGDELQKAGDDLWKQTQNLGIFAASSWWFILSSQQNEIFIAIAILYLDEKGES